MDSSGKSGNRRARPTFTDQEALQFHQQGRPGKIEVVATKPMATQRDLSLAYSPGVAVPVKALDLTGREIGTTKLVCNGAGAAGIASLELLKAIGFAPQNVILCDTKGVIYRGRHQGMNQWKSAHAVETKARTLAEALEGADVF